MSKGRRRKENVARATAADPPVIEALPLRAALSPPKADLRHLTLPWLVVDAPLMDELACLTDTIDVSRRLRRHFFPSSYDDGALPLSVGDSALLEYYVHLYWFAAREQRFPANVASGVLSVGRILMRLIERHLCSPATCLSVLRWLIGIDPESNASMTPEPLFSAVQATLIAEFFDTTLLAHIRLYQNLFASRARNGSHEPTARVFLHLDYPILPDAEPLSHAITLDEYEERVRIEADRLAVEQRREAEEALKRELERVSEGKLSGALIDTLRRMSTSASQDQEKEEKEEDKLAARMVELAVTAMRHTVSVAVGSVREAKQARAHAMERLVGELEEQVDQERQREGQLEWERWKKEEEEKTKKKRRKKGKV